MFETFLIIYKEGKEPLCVHNHFGDTDKGEFMRQEVLMPNGERISREEIRQRKKAEKESLKKVKEDVKDLKEEAPVKEEVSEVNPLEIDHLGMKTSKDDLILKAEALGLPVKGLRKDQLVDAIEEHLNPEL